MTNIYIWQLACLQQAWLSASRAWTNISPFGGWRTATNAGTAGVLPPTTGGSGNGANAPTISAVVVGGLA